ncbi:MULTISPECIES: hypothetical protein [Nocardia]|uniref:Uncharacterized protein n=1 Tax=Nocardia aurea TaxID=2144174 RepID=A0ABV3FMI7_9NOCA|nr:MULTISPECIES: hypothetical protein [Nocardia]
MVGKLLLAFAVAGTALIGSAGNASAGYGSLSECLTWAGVRDRCVTISDGTYVVLKGYGSYSECLTWAGVHDRCYQDPNRFWYITPV